MEQTHDCETNTLSGAEEITCVLLKRDYYYYYYYYYRHHHHHLLYAGYLYSYS